MASLITLEEYRTRRDLADEGGSLTNVEAAIEAASGIMVDECGRKFLRASHSEMFTGNGSCRYYATHCRILALDEGASVTAPVLYYYAGTASGTNWIETTRSFEFDTEQGYIWFTDPFDSFYPSNHRDNWKLDYFYGWPVADIPPALKHICGRLTHLLLEQGQHDGMTSQSFGGGTTSYALDTIPADLKKMLSPYRSPRVFEC